MMRRVHFAAGVLTVLVFAATGQFMRHHAPPLPSLGDVERLMYRSRHIYILAAGLVNLMAGLHSPRKAFGWRAAVRRIGSVLVLASPVLLITAFVIEPARGFQPEMLWSSAGLYTLMGGCLLHTAAGADLSFRG
jgi:hypothetical protein